MASRRSKLRGLRISSPDDLAESLHNAAGAKLSKVRHFGKARVLIELDWQGQKQAFLADVVEVWQGEIPDTPTMSDLMQVIRANRIPNPRAKVWAIDELAEAGLPLYWSGEWLDKQYERLGSYKAVASEFGYSVRAIEERAREVHAMRRNKHLTPEEMAEAKELWLAGNTSMREIARALGCARTTIRVLLKGIEGGPPPIRNRGLPAEKARAHELWRAGLRNRSELARRLGCGSTTLSRWCREFESAE